MNLIIKLINIIFYLILPPKKYAKYLGVKFGKNCRISTKHWGSEPYLIEIGNHVHITTGVRFINHDGGVWVFRENEPDFDIFGKICIGNNTFIGNYTTILPGVRIGNNCVIGANSVITKSIHDNSVVAGNPAKYITNIDDYYNKVLKINSKLKSFKNKKEKILSMDENLFIIKSNLKNE